MKTKNTKQAKLPGWVENTIKDFKREVGPKFTQPLVSPDDKLSYVYTCFEWWNGDKKLTLYIDLSCEYIDYIKTWTGKNGEIISDGGTLNMLTDSRGPLWRWLWG